MRSSAESSNLVGFFSYSRDDDEDSRGALTRLRDRIQLWDISKVANLVNPNVVNPNLVDPNLVNR
jgi:hypothetical protein